MSVTSDDELPPLERLIFAPRPRAARRSQIDISRPDPRESSAQSESLSSADDSDRGIVTRLGVDGRSSDAVALNTPTIYNQMDGPIRFKADESDYATSADGEEESDDESLEENDMAELSTGFKARLLKVLLEVLITVGEFYYKVGVVLLRAQLFILIGFFVFLGYCAIFDGCATVDVYAVRLGIALNAVFEHLYEAFHTVSIGLCEASQIARGSDTAVCLVRNTEAREAMKEFGQHLWFAWQDYVVRTVIYGQRLQIAAT